jgi:hypothetical protein
MRRRRKVVNERYHALYILRAPSRIELGPRHSSPQRERGKVREVNREAHHGVMRDTLAAQRAQRLDRRVTAERCKVAVDVRPRAWREVRAVLLTAGHTRHDAEQLDALVDDHLHTGIRAHGCARRLVRRA